MLVVTPGAQWGVLPFRPLLVWQPLDCVAPVAEPAGVEPAVDAGPTQHVLVPSCEDLHRVPSHGNTMGGRSVVVNVR